MLFSVLFRGVLVMDDVKYQLEILARSGMDELRPEGHMWPSPFSSLIRPTKLINCKS